ncbi:MAG: DUF4381 domain-containing protein [Woeseiaceae bacterium]|nr:DUF4381 domain-containing protein [Woeseiaceae bacterium]
MNPEDIPLRDLHLPEPVGWWPPAPGWLLLLLLAAAALAWYGWRVLPGVAREPPRAAHRRWPSSSAAAAAYRRDGDAVTLARRLSSLVRRAMLAYAPRAEVAGLTGARWLAWLDRGLERPLFTEGPGASLVWLPYRGESAADDAVAAEALIKAVEERLRTPLPEVPY